jgi:FMN reductase
MALDNGWQPLVVGLGGSGRAGSSSENALRLSLDAAAECGAITQLFAGADLMVPLYDPSVGARSDGAVRLIDALRRADGVLLASPGYHGSMSGVIKNLLDYIEDLRDDSRPYLDGRAVGCIVCAHGWQATGTTLTALRSVVHALRAWPTPVGVAINSAQNVFDKQGVCSSTSIDTQLRLVARQVVDFARMRRALDTVHLSPARAG